MEYEIAVNLIIQCTDCKYWSGSLETRYKHLNSFPQSSCPWGKYP